MRFLRQSMIGMFLASATLGLLIYAVAIVNSAVQDSLADERPAPPPRERVFAVNLVTAEVTTEIPILETFGEIEARRTLELRAAVAGRIVGLSPEFEDGASVKAGDLLVSIDPSDLEAQVARLSADLADAEAEERDAERGLDLALLDLAAAEQQASLRQQAFERQLGLADRGVGSAASVETAELAAAAAEAVVITRRQATTQAEARIDLAATRLARAGIALAEAKRDLDDTTIVAPFDGTLSDTSVVEGGLTAVNERLAELIDPSDLEVAFRVSTAQYARLLDTRGDLINAPVTVSLDAVGSDLDVDGVIARVNAGAGEGQTGRLVFAHLQSARGFRPGDFVTVRVQEPAVRNVVRLPASAYHNDGYVLALSGEDRLERVAVDLVRRQGNEVLLRGVDLTGREIVSELSPLLGEGVAVRPFRMPQDSAAATVPSYLELTDERRARLVAFVQKDTQMPQETKDRMLAQLAEKAVPRQVVYRLERRMGG